MISILMTGFFSFIELKNINNVGLFMIATWSLYTCMIFMPYLQERYGYVLDIFLIISIFVCKKIIVIVIPELILSFVSYMPALFIPKLFENMPFLISLSCISLLIYSAFTYLAFSKLRYEDNSIQKNQLE